MSVAQIKTRSVLALLDANAAGVVPRSTVMWVGAEEPARFSSYDP